MLRPNYEILFNQASQKLCNKNQTLLDRLKEGKPTIEKMITYSPFVAISIINNLIKGSTENNMNTNLDYLLQKWDY